MAALEKLSPLAQMYESEFQRAFKLYGDGRDDVKADEAFASVAGFSTSLVSGAGIARDSICCLDTRPTVSCVALDCQRL
jgi:hypothetical protein